MKTYFISGELYDNHEEFNCTGPFSRLIMAPSAKAAWDEVIIEVKSEGSLVLIKEIKVIE